MIDPTLRGSTTATDEQIVAEAVAAREDAEGAEEEASPSRWREADSYAELSKRGWSMRRISSECDTNKDTVSRFIRCVDRIGTDTRPSFWHAYAEVTGERTDKMAVHHSSASDEWATPQDFFDLLAAEFDFTLDVCALESSAKCERYFSPEDDGLARDWAGVCWMNPPYGTTIGQWVRKAWESAEAGAIVVCLLPARTDTGWWWDYCRHGEVRFLRGRLKFGGSDTSAPFPSAVVVFGYPARVVWWERG